jgi:hypothetical protein
MPSLLNKVGNWFRKPEPVQEQCLQCGLKPGREYMVATDEPILHPHQCSWCKSVMYVPGAMFACKTCTEGVQERAA